MNQAGNQRLVEEIIRETQPEPVLEKEKYKHYSILPSIDI